MHRGSSALQLARELRHRWFLSRAVHSAAQQAATGPAGLQICCWVTMAVADGREDAIACRRYSGGAACGLWIVAVAEAGGGEVAAASRSLVGWPPLADEDTVVMRC